MRWVSLTLVLGGCTAAADSQFDVDQQVVYALLDTTGFFYNQNILGLPVGPQDATADCLQGGSLHAVGATTDDGTLATVDLLHTFTDCRVTDPTFDLVFNGEVSVSGSFSSSGFKAMGYSAGGLAAAGTSLGEDVDEVCDLAVSDEASAGEDGSVNGLWCGRDISF